mgnify:CR=1 FL=1
MQFATNVLNYFWMTQAFREILKRSAPARIVDVASYYAGDLDIHDLEFKRRRYHNQMAFYQAVLAHRDALVEERDELQSVEERVEEAERATADDS